MKKNRIKYGITILWVVYLILAIVCGILLVYRHDLATVVIDALFFVIVAMAFIYATISFRKVNLITNDLYSASDKIEEYSEKYPDTFKEHIVSVEGLQFKNSTFRERYTAYIQEITKLESSEIGKVKCDIENYLNVDLIMITIKNDILNLVSGTMTGLGILGTFVGLAWGLQSFSTGNAEEIANSISPLMDGIKVAFYTSIYGTFFSITFSFIHKFILTDAMDAMDCFLETYEKYVTGDVENDNISTMKALFQEMPKVIGQELNKSIQESLVPEFIMLNQSFREFALKMGENQIQSLNTVVENFVAEMNAALSGDFEKLSKSIDVTCKMQQENSEMMQEAFVNVNDIRGHLLKMNETIEGTVETYSNYVTRVESLQQRMDNSFCLFDEYLKKQSEENVRLSSYITQLADYEIKVSDAATTFSTTMTNQMASLKAIQDEMNQSAKEHMETFTEVLTNQSQSFIDSLQSQNNEFSTTLDKQNKLLLENVKEQQTKYIENLHMQHTKYVEILQAENSLHIQNLQEQNTQYTTAMQNQYDLMALSTKQHADDFNTALKDQFTLLNNSAEQIQASAQNQLEKIGTFVVDTQQTIINANEQYQKNTHEQLQSINDSFVNATKKMSEELSTHTKNHMDTMSEQTKSHIHEMEESKKAFMGEIMNHCQLLSDMQQTITTAVKDYIRHTEEMAKVSEAFNARISDASLKKLNEIKVLSTETKQCLDSASKEMAKAAKLFNSELVSSLELTFKSFDRNLTDITNHLSGTIKEVEKTTERVPRVVNIAYEGMETNLKELQDEIIKMAKILSQANENVSTK